MYKLAVKSVVKDHSQVDNVNYLKVELEISDTATNEVVEYRNLGFSYDMTEEQLNAELQKFLQTYTQEKEMAVKNRETEAQEANADELINAFQGKEITLEDSVSENSSVETERITEDNA